MCLRGSLRRDNHYAREYFRFAVYLPRGQAARSLLIVALSYASFYDCKHLACEGDAVPACMSELMAATAGRGPPWYGDRGAERGAPSVPPLGPYKQPCNKSRGKR